MKSLINIETERNELVREMKTKKKKNIKKFLIKMLFATLIVILVFLIISVIASIIHRIRAPFIGEKKYDIIELHAVEDENRLYYSYIDKDKKIVSEYIHYTEFKDHLYSSEKSESYVTFGEYGYDNEVLYSGSPKLYISTKLYSEAYKKIAEDE